MACRASWRWGTIQPMEAIGYDLEVERVDGPDLEIGPCPVCGGSMAMPVYQIADPSLDIVLCRGCGLGSLHPMPDPDRVRSFYRAPYYGSGGRKFTRVIERLVAAVADARARTVALALRPGARILDVGCGRGLWLTGLVEQGFDVHGFEVSDDAVEGIDPRIEVRIDWDLAAAGYPGEHFDCVLLWHVLEHLPAPRRTLEEVHRLLRPGGCLLLAIPNLNSLQASWAGPAWFHLDPPRHLYHFPLAALERLLASSGFVDFEVSHFSLRQNPFGWVQSLLNCWRWLPRCGLYSLLQGARPHGMSALQSAVSLLVFILGMPVAVVLSALAAVGHSGATVRVAARKEGG